MGVGKEKECHCAGEGPSCNCDGSWKGVCKPVHVTSKATAVVRKFLSAAGKSGQGQSFGRRSKVATYTIIAFLLFCASRSRMRVTSRFSVGVHAPFMSIENE